eukprot:TRINITY_DN425_c1_g1_i8.p1 TRINITY_DN425_c1_g1~~TRINITY_DN425_c1_g1_i8.p1  ORF type:complete len:120 (-),score=10.45 TRINITY_DN425_c1_g1_i8:22-381(-)
MALFSFSVLALPAPLCGNNCGISGSNSQKPANHSKGGRASVGREKFKKFPPFFKIAMKWQLRKKKKKKKIEREKRERGKKREQSKKSTWSQETEVFFILPPQCNSYFLPIPPPPPPPPR